MVMKLRRRSAGLFLCAWLVLALPTWADEAQNAVPRISGSEQEFDKKPISRGFPKSHEFGLGDGHTLSLEE
jgi:hypothetical protein